MAPVSRPDKEEFTKLYLSGMPVYKLAEKYLVSVPTVKNFIKEFGLHRKKDLNLDREKLKGYRSNHLSIAKISQLLGCSSATVRRYINLYEIK